MSKGRFTPTMVLTYFFTLATTSKSRFTLATISEGPFDLAIGCERHFSASIPTTYRFIPVTNSKGFHWQVIIDSLVVAKNWSFP